MKGTDVRQVYLRNRDRRADSPRQPTGRAGRRRTGRRSPRRSAPTAGWSPSQAAPATSSTASRRSRSTSTPGRRGSDDVELVSRSSDGTPGGDASAFPAVTADGGSVAFASLATNLVPGDTTGGLVTGGRTSVAFIARSQIYVAGDIFVRDRSAGRTTRVSVARGNDAEANGYSMFPSISSTGQYVAFTSLATNLVGAGPQRRRARRLRPDPPPADRGRAEPGRLRVGRPRLARRGPAGHDPQHRHHGGPHRGHHDRRPGRWRLLRQRQPLQRRHARAGQRLPGPGHVHRDGERRPGREPGDPERRRRPGRRAPRGLGRQGPRSR